MTQTYDLTHWIYARHIDCMDTPCIHANDNGHEEWQDWFHVKPWATDSIYNYVDWALINRASWEVYSNGYKS